MSLSIMGLYQYDQTIFNAIDLPAGIDRDTLVAHILVECAELEIMIPDPDVLKESLTYWSRAQRPIWERLYRTTQLEYNPIWNKDGTITETRDLRYTDNEDRDLQSTDNEDRDLASSADSTTTGKVSAFNASTMQDAEQSIATGSGTDTGTIDRSRSDTGTIERNRTDAGTITRREQGNIGVTTTQQMIKEEREVSTFNIYVYITQSFKSMYCLGVY